MKFLQISVIFSITFGILAVDREWWKHANIYEIYVRSFKDSDGDGIGDIKGVISKLDYLADIGVNTIYLTPFHPSTMADAGYDITDFKGIDPVYGTMEDFELLMKEMKSRGLYFLLDLVINHSSDEHEWFQKSIKKISPYSDYYVWVNAKGYDSNKKPIPPNNWFSFFSLGEYGSAWTWNEERKQFYLHQCLAKQPDLDLRNEAVKKEIKDIMKFWLDKGVTGFRVDVPYAFIEDDQLRDNAPVSPDATAFTLSAYCERTLNHPDTFKFINELNLFVRQYDRETRKRTQTPLIGENYGPVDIVIRYYGTRNFPVFHFPFNFHLNSLTTYLDARQLHDFLHVWLDKVPKGQPSNWVLGNHDQGRIGLRFTTEYNAVMLALVALLPGSSTVYYGEELSMGANLLVQKKDKFDRFFHRSPMHWDNTQNAGFTSAEKPWLPVHPSYWHLNVETQSAIGNSSLNYFKDLISLRKTDVGKYGNLKFYLLSTWILAYTRTYKRTSYVVVMNLGTETQSIDLHISIEGLSKTLTVLAASPNSGYSKGFKMESTPNYPNSYELRPHSVIILSSE